VADLHTLLCMLGIWVLALSMMLLVPFSTHCLILALRLVYTLYMGPQALYTSVIWVLVLIYDASGACQHSLPHIGLAACVCCIWALNPFECSAYGSWPFFSMMVLVSLSTHCLILALRPVCMLCISPLHTRHIGLVPYLRCF
jgi:hypothetical protein